MKHIFLNYRHPFHKKWKESISALIFVLFKFHVAKKKTAKRSKTAENKKSALNKPITSPPKKITRTTRQKNLQTVENEAIPSITPGNYQNCFHLFEVISYIESIKIIQPSPEVV